jgi:hypothetical protein
MQTVYPVDGGSVKVSRAFVCERSVDEAVEEIVYEAVEQGRDLTHQEQFDIMSVQNVCSPATGKENRI